MWWSVVSVFRNCLVFMLVLTKYITWSSLPLSFSGESDTVYEWVVICDYCSWIDCGDNWGYLHHCIQTQNKNKKHHEHIWHFVHRVSSWFIDITILGHVSLCPTKESMYSLTNFFTTIITLSLSPTTHSHRVHTHFNISNSMTFHDLAM